VSSDQKSAILSVKQVTSTFVNLLVEFGSQKASDSQQEGRI